MLSSRDYNSDRTNSGPWPTLPRTYHSNSIQRSFPSLFRAGPQWKARTTVL